MSLQVWLPLNGNLNNNGLSKITWDNAGVFTSGIGKIGTSAFIHQNNKVTGTLNKNINLNNGVSICYWYYLVQDSDQMGAPNIISLRINNSNIFGLSKSAIYRGNTSQAGWLPSQTGWHQKIIIFYPNNIVKMFIDGIFNQEVNISSWPALSSYEINSIVLDNQNLGDTLYINDMRVYDHCLSQKEIEEISKGLILHYKLDNTYKKNILTTNTTSTITIADGATSQYSSYWYLDTNVASSIKQNTVLTVEYDYQVENLVSTASAYVYDQFNTSRVAPSKSLNYATLSSNPTGHVVTTFIVSEAQATYAYSFRFRCRLNNATPGDSVTISNIKMYVGPPSNNIYDSSGYNNTGTIVGLLNNFNSSPRYDCATTFNGSSGYISFSPLLTTDQRINEFTFVAWIKNTSETTSAKSIFRGPAHIYLYQGASLRISWFAENEDASYSANNTWAPTAAKVTPPLNTWTQVAFTSKDGLFTAYMNGVAQGTSSRNPLLKGNQGSNVGDSFIGDISDVRWYATALTAEQIAELYHTSVSLDSSGNIYARELISEESHSNNISKTGQLQTEIFRENNVGIKVSKSGLIDGGQFYEY